MSTAATAVRIVTRPDFDGVVCAVLIADALAIGQPVHWLQPNDFQTGAADVRAGDVVANLPFHPDCALWFDHHATNIVYRPFNGLFRMTPSAARNVHEYFKAYLKRDFQVLVGWADRIDAADFTQDMVLHPESYDFVLLSMTLAAEDGGDAPYWEKLVRLLMKEDIQRVMADSEVESRCRRVIVQNGRYAGWLKAYTTVTAQVAVTDFRPLESAPSGNRFLVYSLFPEACVHVRIRYADPQKQFLVVNVGHSIFNLDCNVHAGRMLTAFEGGGHRGAGSTRFHASKAEDYIPRIIQILQRNDAGDR
jgi:oligoribonuclease NrnB/cAMP/cGMP phosphodiesterase (DHH superfamily)